MACERVLIDMAASGRLRYATLRYFNAAGADLDGEIGEAHVPETHLIPLAVRATRDPKSSLDVFGRDFPTRDGTAVRDYIHVVDLADAHVRALERVIAGDPALCLNLGTGKGTSVQDVIDTCQLVLGAKPQHRDAPRRSGDVASLVADASRARDVLGWTPRRSDIVSIVDTAAIWDSKLHSV
jgi:UDP-glucose 4-epimerase